MTFNTLNNTMGLMNEVEMQRTESDKGPIDMQSAKPGNITERSTHIMMS